jgi:hypothetical protein
MNNSIPLFVSFVFLATTILTGFLFTRALNTSNARPKRTIIFLIAGIWLSIQAILSGTGFYLDTVGNIPPLFPIFGFFPLFVFMGALFNTAWGRAFVDSLSLERLTWISMVRIPVEVVLWLLFTYQVIPEVMTFEGGNFDILAGLTAPVIAYFGYKKGVLPKWVLLAWNILSLILLLTIISLAMLSFPTQFQQLGSDIPNTGILYFPFFWLPSFIVPVVMFSHFVSIRKLLKG